MGWGLSCACNYRRSLLLASRNGDSESRDRRPISASGRLKAVDGYDKGEILASYDEAALFWGRIFALKFSMSVVRGRSGPIPSQPPESFAPGVPVATGARGFPP